MPRKLLASGQLARELGLAPGTVSRYARQGILTPEVITAGGQYRFDLETAREELRQLAEKRRRQREQREQDELRRRGGSGKPGG